MLGYRSVRDMRTSLTVKEYQQWALLDEWRQVGPRRADLRAATVVGSQGANINKTLDAWEVKPPQSDEDIKTLFMAMCGA